MDIMLDLETWGTTPGSDIRSIGAVAFSSDTQPPEWLTFYIACDNPEIDPIAYRQEHGWDNYIIHRDNCGGVPRRYPLRRDPRTVQWWSEQSDEAQAAFADPVDLADALTQFSAWLFNIAADPAIQLKECRKCNRPYESYRQICDWCGTPSEPPT